MPFSVTIEEPTGNNTVISLDAGTSTYLVGANGSGKTRLAALIEADLGLNAHRISAHRALTLNPAVAKIREADARAGLRSGYTQMEYDNATLRPSGRWGQRSETHLLNDFDFLIQTLFAEQNNTTHRTHKAAHDRTLIDPEFSCLDKICAIWSRILPHRELLITGDDIKVQAPAQTIYSAADMSDGERAVFYLLGQILVANTDMVLIFDEPELHIHRAILAKLWDEIEAARPDCAFLVITHDLEFAATRPGQKFVIRDFQHPASWTLEEVPEETGFSEDMSTLILGSRRPILFVEGTGSSLDLALYRACYPDWTVMPRGSCEQVIHAVTTFRANRSLSRITCAGIVDADDRTAEEVARLDALGIKTLPVSEIENLFLLPEVARVILEMENHTRQEIDQKLSAMTDSIIDSVREADQIEKIVTEHCRRRVDQAMKRIGLAGATNPTDLKAKFLQEVAQIEIDVISSAARLAIETAIASRDLATLLKYCDLKRPFKAIGAQHLKNTRPDHYESWLNRTLRSGAVPNKLMDAVSSVLPTINAS